MSAEVTATPANSLDTYPAVLLGLLLVILTYVFSIYNFAMKSRIAVFRRTFMRQFDEMHCKEVKGYDKAPQFGYPDCGSGVYSQKLPYADWFKINCGQRVQLNFLEQLPIIMITILVAGLKYKFYTFVLSVTYCVARLMYGFGYMIAPSKRVAGALLQDVVMLGLIGLAYHSAWTLTQ